MGIQPASSHQYSHALCRKPGRSVVRGLRSTSGEDPDYEAFAKEHVAYVEALRQAGLDVTVLDPLETFPDSVFVEDVALCIAEVAIILRPGATSRFGEREAATDALSRAFSTVIDLDSALVLLDLAGSLHERPGPAQMGRVHHLAVEGERHPAFRLGLVERLDQG